MDDEPQVFAHSQPSHWFVCFSPVTATWWVPFLAAGKYRHVRAFGTIPRSKIWLFVDVNAGGLTLRAAPDGPAAEAAISAWIAGCDVLHIARRDAPGLPRWPVFSCVTTIRHLIGLRSGALRPDRLFRDMLAAGAKKLDGQESTRSSAAAPRPDAGPDCGTG